MSESISLSQREAMLDWQVSCFHPMTISWNGRQSVRDGLATELDTQIARLTDHRFAEEFREAIGIGTGSDYLPRLIDIDQTTLLCGIRFYGGDKTRPFVDILASTADFQDWSHATRLALQEFKRFSPRRVRLLRTSAHEPEVGSGLNAVLDQVISAGLCQELSEGHCQSAYTLALEDAEPEAAFAFLTRQYEAFSSRNPELAARVFASDLDDLRSCGEGGRLAWWLVDGQRAGLIAVCRDVSLGFDCYLMIEEVVAPEFAGRGSAAAAQRAMAAWCVERDPESVLFGTIDGANIPSRRAAQRAGRHEVAAWWFLMSGDAPDNW